MSEQQHYRSILKSSTLIGGSAFINILIGMVRTKFVAVLLGPAGVGLIGLFGSILGPITTICGFGIATSGVRQIAEAHGQGNEPRIAEVVTVLRRTVWVTGVLGCLVTVALSPWLSRWTFKSSEHTGSIAILGLTVLLGNIAVGQSCIIQGVRRIGDLAKTSVLGALSGTLISIPCYYAWGLKGIVPSLLLVSIASLATSWYYAHKVALPRVVVSAEDAKTEVRKLLGFGLPIMANGLQAGIVAYFMRLIILNQFGLEGLGVWGAAFSISGMLVGFVLNAMAADYYPRLAEVAHDNRLIAKEVNAQTEVALLLATPALLVTILFAPLAIQLLYSGKFDAAIPILRWSVYGILGRVISWPLGFIILAQGRGRLFFLSELVSSCLHAGLLFFCSKRWGLTGTGIAFMLLYVMFIINITIIAQWIAKTHWNLKNAVLIVSVITLLTFAGVLHKVIASRSLYYVISIILVTAVSSYMIRKLSQRSGMSLAVVLAKVGIMHAK